MWLHSLFCRFHCLSPQILQLFAEIPSLQSVRTSLRVFLLVFHRAPNPRFSISLQLQLPMSCDIADLMPQHVILVRRLDAQSNTGRLTLEIRGCAESATDRTSSLRRCFFQQARTCFPRCQRCYATERLSPGLDDTIARCVHFQHQRRVSDSSDSTCSHSKTAMSRGSVGSDARMFSFRRGRPLRLRCV